MLHYERTTDRLITWAKDANSYQPESRADTLITLVKNNPFHQLWPCCYDLYTVGRVRNYYIPLHHLLPWDYPLERALGYVDELLQGKRKHGWELDDSLTTWLAKQVPEERFTYNTYGHSFYAPLTRNEVEYLGDGRYQMAFGQVDKEGLAYSLYYNAVEATDRLPWLGAAHAEKTRLMALEADENGIVNQEIQLPEEWN